MGMKIDKPEGEITAMQMLLGSQEGGKGSVCRLSEKQEEATLFQIVLSLFTSGEGWNCDISNSMHDRLAVSVFDPWRL